MKLKTELCSILPLIVLLLILLLAANYCVIVVGDSMEPTFHSGQLLLFKGVDDVEIASGDVIVFTLEGEHKQYIKRVIGTPNTTVEITSAGVVLVDGKAVDRCNPGTQLTTVLGDDEYFVLGDNREISADSRVFGAIKLRNIKGTVNAANFG